MSIMPRRAPSFGSMRRKRAFLDVSNRPRQRSLLRRLEAAKIAIAPSLDAQVNIFVTDRIAAASAAPTTRIALRRGGKRQRGQKLIEASLKRTAQGSGAPIRDLAKTAAQRGILVLSCDQIEREMTRMGVPANPVPTVHDSSSSSSSRGKKTKRKPLPRVVLSDADHLYLPIIKEFSSPTDSKSTAAGPPCPVLNPDAAEGSCPFVVKRARGGGAVRANAPAPAAAAASRKRRMTGYCECCGITYTGGLQRHLRSRQHRDFASNDANYKDLDAFCKARGLDCRSPMPAVSEGALSRNGEQEDSGSNDYPVKQLWPASPEVETPQPDAPSARPDVAAAVKEIAAVPVTDAADADPPPSAPKRRRQKRRRSYTNPSPAVEKEAVRKEVRKETAPTTSPEVAPATPPRDPEPAPKRRRRRSYRNKRAAGDKQSKRKKPRYDPPLPTPSPTSVLKKPRSRVRRTK